MKTWHLAVFAALFLAAPGVALGHGFDIELNSTWTGVTVQSDEPQLDNGGTVGGGTSTNLNTLFLADFNGTPSTNLTGNTYYLVAHGFGYLGAGMYGIPSSDYLTATFNIISPLYFSDGSAGSTASGAVVASSGTSIQMYDADYSTFSGPTYVGASPGYVSISGSTPFAAGFQTSMDDPHEILKELYFAPGSTQTYGEYGFAFDVTLTLGNGTTIVTPPLVDIFAVADPNLGDFGDKAPDTAQDAATLSIFYAATAAGNAALGNTQSWNGSLNSTWSNASNWESGIVPGSTSGTTSNDTVVFYSGSTAPTIDAGRNVQTILFELNVGALTLGTTTSNALLLTNGGSIQVTSTVTNPQIVNAPLVLEGASALYTFSNDSLSSSATLSFGGAITGEAAGNTVLMLGGDNTGNNTISGAISNGSATSLAIVENGGICNWILSGPNSYTGGTTVNQGTLTVTATGTLGSSTSPLTIASVAAFDSATVNINGNQSVGNLSGTINGLDSTGALNIAAGSSLTVNQSASTTFGATLTIASGAAGNSGNFSLQGSGTLEMDAAPTLGDNSVVNVDGGTLRFNPADGPGTIGANVTVTVAAAATLQLAGLYAALSGGGMANIVNNGSIASHGGLLVTGTNQIVGTISGTASSSPGPTTYSGDTIVGDGSSAADLTANQILQNSLTINAGSTVTIAPSGTGFGDATAAGITAAGATANSATIPSGAASDSLSAADSAPLMAIQNAIAGGAITAATGQMLELRIAAIERLAAAIPGIDASLIEDRVLAAIPASDWPTGSSLTSPTSESSCSLISSPSITADSDDEIAASGSVANTFGAAIGAAPAAVPEPSGLLLAIVAAFAAAALLARRRAGMAFGDAKSQEPIALARE